MENQGLPRTMVIVIVSLIFLVLFGSSIFYTIEPGEKELFLENLVEV